MTASLICFLKSDFFGCTAPWLLKNILLKSFLVLCWIEIHEDWNINIWIPLLRLYRIWIEYTNIEFECTTAAGFWCTGVQNMYSGYILFTFSVKIKTKKKKKNTKTKTKKTKKISASWCKICTAVTFRSQMGATVIRTIYFHSSWKRLQFLPLHSQKEQTIKKTMTKTKTKTKTKTNKDNWCN